jgi:hypothetical protein
MEGTMKKEGKKDIGLFAPLCAACVLFFAVVFTACDMYEYGQLGGADRTSHFAVEDSTFKEIMSFMSGVWYSHYAGIGRLDGYRIGLWKDFKTIVEDSGKDSLFPNLVKETYTTESGSNTPRDDDFFLLYDDTVYGQSDNGAGGNESWGFGYLGIVRAINVFNGDPNRGAIIIEYLKGCAPGWLNRWPDSSDGKRPFFGIYYRILEKDTVQMANAVDLEALYNGEKYYTETAHLNEAREFNSVENEAEFISWGVVIPQNRE